MESTLTMDMSELLSEAGSFLGWGRNAARWTTEKREDLDEVLKSALRRFYFQAGHEWTFLKPVATITLITGERSIPLPEDFGGFEGRAFISSADNSGGYWPINQIAAEQIRAQYAGTGETPPNGRPLAFADEPRRPTANRSSRNELLVYPLPDQAYKFQCAYSILPNYLTEKSPWAYGGAAHAETLKAGVRAAAELFEDSEIGPQAGNYAEALLASIAYDRRHAPKSLGVNTDLSDSIRVGGMWPDGLWTPLGIGYLGPVRYT